MRSMLRRPSPSFVVSVVALVVAMAGTSYAALALPKNSVGTRQLKNRAVTTKKIANGAVTVSKINTNGLSVPAALNATNAVNATNASHASNADNATNAAELGGVGANGYEGRAMWALINDDGSVLEQSGGISVTHPFTGGYYVAFPQPADGKGIVVTPKDNETDVARSVITAPCGDSAPAVDCAPHPNGPDDVYVAMLASSNGAYVNQSFYIVVLP